MTEIIGRDARSRKVLRVRVEDGRIDAIDEVEDISGVELFVSAAFIDLQVNGFAGFDMNAAGISADSVIGLADALLEQGTLCFVPTLITADEDRICHALQVISDARSSSGRIAASIPYVHLEGPHISPLDGYRGAHPASQVRPPSIAEFERWQQISGDLVGMVTLSPHYPSAPAYIAHLASRGVQVALGHSHATPDQIRVAIDAGARLSTHLGNGLPAEIPRHRNPLWSQLADDRLTASVIADGHHLPADLLSVLLRAKGGERVVLVSDAVALAGMPPGIYDAPVGGKVELHADGRLCLAGTELLAGSTATLAQCVSGMMRATGISLADALAMATAHPGRFVSGRGRLERGARADLIRFRANDSIEIEDAWLLGKRVCPGEASRATNLSEGA